MDDVCGNAVSVQFFFLLRCRMNIPITGPVLKTKAREIAQTFDVENFQASNGCLESFTTQRDTKRHEETEHSLYYCLVNWQEYIWQPLKTGNGNCTR
jgi:hypothetical protein